MKILIRTYWSGPLQKSLELINFILFSDMKQAFDLFDKNNDGKISSDELGRVLRTLGYKYSNDEVQEMISNVDTNGTYARYRKLKLPNVIWKHI